MSAFASPWALVGLLALPLLVLLHRRRRRAVAVDVPSLLFLEGEPADASAPERVRFDRDLWLGLAALACLSLAAAGPRIAGAGTGRVVRVVLMSGPSTHATPGGGRAVAAALAEVRGAIDVAVRSRGDRLDATAASSPGAVACAAEAARGEADVRIAVCDRPVPGAPRGVHVVAVGDPAGRNVGIVAADVVPDGEGVRAFLTLYNDDARAASRRLEVRDGARVEARLVELAPFSARSVEVPFAAPVPARLDVRALPVPGSGDDDLRGDDALALSRAPLRVAFASAEEGLPDAHRAAVLAALDAILGAGGTVPATDAVDLFVAPLGVTRADAELTLFLSPIRDDTQGTRLRAPRPSCAASRRRAARASGSRPIRSPARPRPSTTRSGPSSSRTS